MVEGSRFKNLIDAVSFAIEVTNKEEAKSPKTIGELIEEKITDAEKKAFSKSERWFH